MLPAEVASALGDPAGVVVEAGLGTRGKDPSPGPGRPRPWSRGLECAWAGDDGAARYPGQIEPPSPRGDYVERDTLVCRERLLVGLRDAPDEALLHDLQATAAELVEAAVAARPDASGPWLVEVGVGDPQVAGKVSFAAKNLLVASGVPVSDRVPWLTPADVAAVAALPAEGAWPSACARYLDAGSIRAGDTVLVVLTLDPRETGLHAGLCEEGRWTWLR